MLLSDLYVHPLRRRQGWADMLCRAVTDYADTFKADLWLYARPFGNTVGANGKALKRATTEALKALYRRHGFVDCQLTDRQDEMVRRWTR